MASTSGDVFALIEEILESGRTPEEVCRDCPELLGVLLQAKEYRMDSVPLRVSLKIVPQPLAPPR